MADDLQGIQRYTPTISKITLPSGNSYWLKDAYARERLEALASALYFVGVTTSDLTDGCTTNPIIVDGNPVNVEAGAIAISSTTAPSKEFVWNGSKWMEFGDLSTLGQLAFQDVVTLNKGTGKNVLGTGAQFAATESSVTFTGETSADVLGANATFTASAPFYSPTNTNIKAIATGAAVGGDTMAAAITSIGTPSTDTFVKSVQATTGKKLVTTVIKGVSGTEDVLQQVTASKKHLGIQNISQITGNTDVTVPTVTSNTGVTIQNVSNVGTADTWNFEMGSGTEAETLIISGTNGTTPTLGASQTATNTVFGTNTTASKVTNADVQVATGSLADSGSGAEIATDVSKTYATVATADANNTTVATGSTASDGDGDAIVTDVTVGDSATAITGITPQTKIFLQSVKVTQQPSVSLSTGATAGDGVISVTTGISATSGVQNVTVTSKDTKTVLQNVGTGTAGAPGIYVSAQDATKVAAYSDLSVTVSKN